MTEKHLSRITFLDKLNTAALMLVTPEQSKVQALRKQNNYGQEPTGSKPPILPFETDVIEGVRVRYARSVHLGKPTILLLSPFPQSILAYAPVWGSLAANYNLIAYDMPGFGLSEGGREYMNFRAQGEFLARFLEHFDLKDVHVVGPDVGMPAAIFQAANGAARLKSIVVGDGPAAKPSANGSIIQKMVDSPFWRAIMRVAGAGALVEAGNQVGYVNYVSNAAELSDYKASYEGRIPIVMEWFIGYPESLNDLNPMLAQVEVPTLIFWGDTDVLLYPENGVRLSGAIPNSELRIIENCGHFAYQDQHEKFSQMLTDWIERMG